MISVGLKKVAAGLEAVANRALEDLGQLRMTRRQVNVSSQWQLARREDLTACDAAYLQLAIELNAPLATYDRTLGAAAARVLSGR